MALKFMTLKQVFLKDSDGLDVVQIGHLGAFLRILYGLVLVKDLCGGA